MMRLTRRRLTVSILLLIPLVVASACSSGREEKAVTLVMQATPSPTAADSEPVMTEAVQGVFERNCKLCHGPDGRGIAAVAPDIRRGPRRGPEDWEKYLRDPKSLHPNSKMPALTGASDEEFKAVAAYLADLTQHNPPPQ